MTANDATDRPLSRRRAMRMAGFTALASGAGLAATSAVAHAQQADAWPIGSWRTHSVTAGPVANRFDLHELLVFIPGGIFLMFDSPVERTANLNDVPTAVEFVGPFAGQWLLAAGGELRATAFQLNYDAQAVLWSEERVDFNLTYDPATGIMSGRWDWRETALDGSPILAAQATLTGSRITVGA